MPLEDLDRQRLRDTLALAEDAIGVTEPNPASDSQRSGPDPP